MLLPNEGERAARQARAEGLNLAPLSSHRKHKWASPTQAGFVFVFLFSFSVFFFKWYKCIGVGEEI